MSGILRILAPGTLYMGVYGVERWLDKQEKENVMSKNGNGDWPPKDDYMHYYVREEGTNRPIAVVAFREMGTIPGKVVRGISIWSPMDKWNRVKGRAKAVGRCMKAEVVGYHAEPVKIGLSRGAMLFLSETDGEFASGDGVAYKSMWAGEPTEREKRILKCEREQAVGKAKGVPKE